MQFSEVSSVTNFFFLIQLTRKMIPKTFKVDMPEALTKEAMKCKTDDEAQQLGVEWCVSQCKELMAHGVPSLHFSSVGAIDSISQVAKNIF